MVLMPVPMIVALVLGGGFVVFMAVLVIVMVIVFRPLTMVMMVMLVGVVVIVFVVMMVILEMNVELDAFNIGLLPAPDMQVITVELQFRQFLLQLARIDSQIDHSAEKHVAADAAENVEVKSLHEFGLRSPPVRPSAAKEFIWLAA